MLWWSTPRARGVQIKERLHGGGDFWAKSSRRMAVCRGGHGTCYSQRPHREGSWYLREENTSKGGEPECVCVCGGWLKRWPEGDQAAPRMPFQGSWTSSASKREPQTVLKRTTTHADWPFRGPLDAAWRMHWKMGDRTLVQTRDDERGLGDRVGG